MKQSAQVRSCKCYHPLSLCYICLEEEASFVSTKEDIEPEDERALSMTELQYCSSSSEEISSDKGEL